MLLILDLAIGLSFVFLLFSLVVTALNELVLSFFDQRAKFMEEGIKELLGQNETTIDNFFAHGLIDSLSRQKDGKPSYIPTDAFVSAVLDEVSKFVVDPAVPRKVRDAGAFATALAGPALDANPKNVSSHAFLAAAYALVGRSEEARAALAAYLERRPGSRVSTFRTQSPVPLALTNAAYRQLFARVQEGLRKSGMPE